MNREIKFRAWGAFGSDKTERMIEDWISSDMPEYVGFGGGEAFRVMQFTGMKDKNGKEIYEGHIVSTVLAHVDSGDKNEEIRTSCEIVFKDAAFWVKNMMPDFVSIRNNQAATFEDIISEHPLSFFKEGYWGSLFAEGGESAIEITGNIFENKELLNKDKSGSTTDKA